MFSFYEFDRIGKHEGRNDADEGSNSKRKVMILGIKHPDHERKYEHKPYNDAEEN